MFVEFFLALKEAQIPVSLREFLVLLEAMERKVVSFNVDDFYFLSRSCLVKDEKNLDKFELHSLNLANTMSPHRVSMYEGIPMFSCPVGLIGMLVPSKNFVNPSLDHSDHVRTSFIQL